MPKFTVDFRVKMLRRYYEEDVYEVTVEAPDKQLAELAVHHLVNGLTDIDGESYHALDRIDTINEECQDSEELDDPVIIHHTRPAHETAQVHITYNPDE